MINKGRRGPSTHQPKNDWDGDGWALVVNTFQIRDHLALSRLRAAKDDNAEAASFDSQNVLFEMYWPCGRLALPLREAGGGCVLAAIHRAPTTPRAMPISGQLQESSAPVG